MSETPEKYKSRILGYLGKQPPVRVLAATPGKLERLIARSSPARLRRQPAPGRWSPIEILAHLADVEVVIGYRIRCILGSPGSQLLGFDQDLWANGMNYRKQVANHSVAAFRASRNHNLRLLRSLKPEHWELHGVHSERGRETVHTVACMTAGHDLNHLSQLESLLKPADNNERIPRSRSAVRKKVARKK